MGYFDSANQPPRPVRGTELEAQPAPGAPGDPPPDFGPVPGLIKPGSFTPPIVDASVEPYEPGNPAAWGANPPGNTAQALDALKAGSGGGGSSGVGLENNGAPVAGGPFTTLNLAPGLTAANAGGGVASVTPATANYPGLPGTGTNGYTGTGTSAEIVPTETQLAFGDPYEVDAFAGPATTNSSAFVTVATIPAPTEWLQAFDCSVTVLGVDPSATSDGTIGVFRGDLLFTVYRLSTGAVTLAASPIAPINVRTAGTATNATAPWNAQAIVSGNTVLIQVSGGGTAAGTGPVHWSGIGQVQQIH